MNKKYIKIGAVVLGVIVLLVLAANYQYIFKKIVPPNPVIVSSKADDFSSKLFDYSMRVKGEVRNEGGDGYIVVEVNASQGEKSWKKIQQLYLEAYQTGQFEIVFDEIKLFESDPDYNVTTYALGSIH